MNLKLYYLFLGSFWCNNYLKISCKKIKYIQDLYWICRYRQCFAPQCNGRSSSMGAQFVCLSQLSPFYQHVSSINLNLCCKHSIVCCQAELNMLKSCIQQTNEECDSIAAELQKLDASLQSSHGNSSNAPSPLKDELVNKLFRKMSFLWLYRKSETGS